MISYFFLSHTDNGRTARQLAIIDWLSFNFKLNKVKGSTRCLAEGTSVRLPFLLKRVEEEEVSFEVPKQKFRVYSASFFTFINGNRNQTVYFLLAGSSAPYIEHITARSNERRTKQKPTKRPIQ